MNQAPAVHAETRARLLEAATRVFAEHGFRNATVREICEHAGANIASVNYHFGDKERLYREVLVHAAKAAIERHPLGAGLPERPTAEQKLCAFIRNFVERLLDEGRPSWHGQLMAREMVDPTGALDELASGFIRPQFERLRDIVRELLGERATEEQVRMCACTVVGQCLFFKNCRPVVERLMPELEYGPPLRGRIVEHVADICLRAFESLRAELARGRAANR